MDEKEQLRRLKGFVNDLLDTAGVMKCIRGKDVLYKAYEFDLMRVIVDFDTMSASIYSEKAEWLKDE